jgi:argininosuccinate synthase
MELTDLRSHRVGILMSGGLACTAVGLWLAENNVDTVAFVADLGQTTPYPAVEAAELLTRQGMKTHVIDLREQLAELHLELVKYQATHDGGYWNTTGAARAALVSGLAGPLRAMDCTVLAHGCVGGGNDQRRFARYTETLAPGLAVFAPWIHGWLLERFPNRQSMTDYLLDRQMPADYGRFVDYSVDENLGGIAHEGTQLEQLSTPARVLDPIMTVWPHAAPDETRQLRIRFVAGRPAEINGEPVSALQAVLLANELGGRGGVPPRSVMENRVNGTKCRGVYEAPGLEVLGQCVAALYQLSLDKAASELMHLLSRHLGRAVYEGRLYDTATRAARASADLLGASATGTVTVEVYKGNIFVSDLSLAADSPGVAQQTRFDRGGHQWAVTARAVTGRA